MSEHGEDTGHEQPTELRDSNPGASGPDRAKGGMGVSSERVGHAGGTGEATDGERDTTTPSGQGDPLDEAGDDVGADAEAEQAGETNPEGIAPKAGYPSLDPRSEDHPYRDA